MIMVDMASQQHASKLSICKICRCGQRACVDVVIVNMQGAFMRSLTKAAAENRITE